MNPQEIIENAAKAEEILPSTKGNLLLWLAEPSLPEWASQSILSLLKQEAWEELNDRFYQNMAFGTGGLRGRTIGRISTDLEQGTPSERGTPAHPAVGANVLNDFNVIRATIGMFRYCARQLKEAGRDEVPKLVIAHDVRHFSRHFCELSASTWSRLGGIAYIFSGPRSTPQLSFTVRYLKATAGVVITASHNPPHDNGFKAYYEDGAQIVEPHASGIINEVNQTPLSACADHLPIDLSRVVELSETTDQAYRNAVAETVLQPELLKKSPPKVVFTPIHGTAHIQCMPLFQHFGLEVDTVGEQMVEDPRFPTVKSPNPENAEALSMAVQKAGQTGADLVIGTDPDNDRMGVAVKDDDGRMVLLSGNQIGSILAEYRITRYKEMGLIPAEGSQSCALIKTFVTTPLQETIAKAHGLKTINTLTGFKWIGEKIKDYEETLTSKLLAEEQLALNYDQTPLAKRAALLQKYSTFYVFGGEESYGYLGSDLVRDKDGNSAVLMFCEAAAYVKSQGKTIVAYLDDLYRKYGFFHECLGQIYYEGAAGSAKIKRILDSYRENPPTELEGLEVTKFTDFGKDTLTDADGKQIPPQNFYFLELSDGTSFAVRGSGTEPKIKFYFFTRREVPAGADLPAIKGELREHADRLREAVETDADQRAQG
ncbi:MAG: phospho-sugar mutase [Opitutales bacterium]|nr:phospho-sugar mutase [Opitutales bacterium]